MKRLVYISFIIPIFLVACQMQGGVSTNQKKKFIDFVKTLPADSGGEFYTKDAIVQASPYLPVLLALDEKDVGAEDLYPFLALSIGLCEQPNNRDYVVRHFAEIRHPELKLVLGVMLFDAGTASSEVETFLKKAMRSPKQLRILREALGADDLASLKRRLLGQPVGVEGSARMKVGNLQ